MRVARSLVRRPLLRPPPVARGTTSQQARFATAAALKPAAASTSSATADSSSSSSATRASSDPATQVKSTPLSLTEVSTLARHRGFVFPGSEQYGGFKGSFDYGPLGLALKRAVADKWWRSFVTSRADCVGLDSAIVAHPQVWVAAGHVANFTDPLVECKSCHARARVDKLVEDAGLPLPAHPSGSPEWVSEMSVSFRSLRYKCSGCRGTDFTEPRAFNLLMTTTHGQTPSYLRPETAQGIFLSFDKVRRAFRRRLPLGIGQIGKAFRNEISPRDFLFRLREFEQMELEYFCEPDQSPRAFDEWVARCARFLVAELGLRPENLRQKAYAAHELAHYALATTDIEYRFPFGWGELWGIANRGDFDLRRHGVGAAAIAESRAATKGGAAADAATDPVATNTAATDAATDPAAGEFPHVVEPSVGLDRLVLALLCDGYAREESAAHSGVRTVLHLRPELAPVRFALLPLRGNDSEQVQLATELHERVLATLPTPHATAELDCNGNIGRRYRRQDEIGTPWCVTIDTESAMTQSVTVRDRDSLRQVRISLQDLERHVRSGEPFPL